MSWNAFQNKSLGIIEVVFAGSPDIAELKEAVIFTLKLCKTKRQTRVLTDCTKIVPAKQDSITRTFELGAFYESLNINTLMKEAIILPESEQAASLIRFFETTARNRGLNIRVFPNREDALEWLLEINSNVSF